MPPDVSAVFLIVTVPEPIPPVPFSMAMYSLMGRSGAYSLGSNSVPVPLSFALGAAIMRPSLLRNFSRAQVLAMPPANMGFATLLLVFEDAYIEHGLSMVVSS